MLLVAGGAHLLTADPVAGVAPIARTADPFPPSVTAVSPPTPSPPASETASPPAMATPVAVAAPPVSVSFPSYEAHAVVVPVGVLDGVLQLPADLGSVGWWAAGAMPGAAEGSTVLAGHVDSQLGTGTLRVLHEVVLGDPVTITDSTGGVHEYRVSERAITAKDELDPEWFTTSGPPRLVLITCGGPFDPTTRHYRDNVVVVAEPVH